MTLRDDTVHSFLFYLNTLERPLPPPQTEYRFHPTRRWRFDLAWPEAKVAVELDGGVWTRGRHVRAKGYEADLEKINAAIERGWVVLRYTPQMIDRNPWNVIEQVKRVVKARARQQAKGAGS